MKVKTEPCDEPEAFHPFTLTLTVESEAEMCELYAIFCHSWIVDGSPHVPADKIRDAIGSPNYSKAFQYLDDVLKRRAS